jgi:hypothetical protein
MKKLILAVILVLMVSSTYADKLITMPTGRTLSTGQFRVEGSISEADENGRRIELAAGLMQFELNAKRLFYRDNKSEDIFGAQWNFLPETFITPAIGFGVTDAFSQTAEGIGVYTAVTKSLKIPGVKFVRDISTTAGLGIKSIRGAFFGVDVTLNNGLFGQLEFDSEQWNNCFGYQPTKTIRIKVSNIHNQRFYGIEYKLLDLSSLPI